VRGKSKTVRQSQNGRSHLRSARRLSRRSSDVFSIPFDAHGDAHAAADAQRGEALLGATALHFVEQRRQHARTRGAGYTVGSVVLYIRDVLQGTAMTEVKDRDHTQARLDFIAAEGRRWQQMHAEAFAGLAPGTTVIIDVATGEYVTGLRWQDAETAFEQRFGKVERLSYTFDVDRPLFIGGGLWRR
jgi:hypothetical protein